MKTVFDIGMYDAADTAYYLESGFRVVAIEANPELADRARVAFACEVSSGRLVCLHAAINASSAPVDLILSGDDLGSSSVVPDKVAAKRPLHSITVPGLTMQDLFDRYGVPHYLKVDIEGADHLCITALTPTHRPRYLSFEAGHDVDRLIEHAMSVGYERFKFINQMSFRDLANQDCVRDRVVRRLARLLGYARPKEIRRAGRFFVTGHSSGPAPWCSDGRWDSGTRALLRWHHARRSGLLRYWYDVHATV